MNAQTALKEILALPEDERRWLVEEIAASLPEQQEDFELTPELKAELDRRLAEHEANPDSGIPWEEVKAHVQAILRK
jgi:putative addiction module component (TIGR02574 family)